MTQPEVAIDQPDGHESLDGAIDFIENSYLSYIIPKATNLDLEEASEDAEDTSTLFDTIEQRESLFFDETVNVHLILRTPWIDESALRSCLSRLRISLDAHITSGTTSEKDEQKQSDQIFQGIVEETDDPFIVATSAEDSDADDEQDQQHLYAVWKLPVFLSRPRIRIQHPVVSFKASASLKPVDAAAALGERDGYMRSGIPAGFNVLESFSNDPSLGGITPRLSALRVSRVAPVTQSKHMMKPIRAQTSLDLQVVPAIHTRVRFSRPNSAPASSALIALLEIDFTPYFECEATIDRVLLSVPESTIEDLNDQSGMTLPMKCWARDHVTFLYRLAPRQVEMTTRLLTRDLSITIEATVQSAKDVCTPQLVLSWTTTLDYTIPVNPGFGSAMQPIQRSHRPSQLSIGGSEASQTLAAPAETRPDALPALEAATAPRTTETVVQDLGLIVTFCAPQEPVYVGEPFSWSVYVVNRTSEKTAEAAAGTNANAAATTSASSRKLALVAVPKRRRNDVRVARPPSTAGKGKTAADARQMADAVLDENVVHAMQRNSVVDITEVVCLSADTRVGPLAQGACHVADLKFVAMKAGIVGLEAIRIVDLGTQEHVDVRELPLMVVHEREEGESEQEEA